MTIKEMQKEVHELAKSKGWWDKPPEFGTLMALVMSEPIEALEEARKGKKHAYYDCSKRKDDICTKEIYCGECEHGKPCGIPLELADAVIRIMDTCEYYGIDLEAAIMEKHQYNKTRPYKHGKSF